MIIEYLEKRPLFTILVLRSGGTDPEFVETCAVPGVGDHVPSAAGWLRVTAIYHMSYVGDCAAVCFAENAHTVISHGDTRQLIMPFYKSRA